MWKFLSKALEDTKASLGWSWSSATKKYLPLGLAAWLYYSFIREDQQMSSWNFGMVQAWVGGMIAAAVLHFLYNLWLAPYRLLEKRLDDELGGTKESTSNLIKEPQPANAALYQNHKTISLYEAACLWVEIEPHYPIVDQRAGAKLSCLKGAVRNGELVCAWRSSWAHIVDTVQGIRDKSPTDHQEVSMVALRQYAEKIGNIPLFLRHVSLPVESPKKEDDKKPSAPSTD